VRFAYLSTREEVPFFGGIVTSECSGLGCYQSVARYYQLETRLAQRVLGSDAAEFRLLAAAGGVFGAVRHRQVAIPDQSGQHTMMVSYGAGVESRVAPAWGRGLGLSASATSRYWQRVTGDRVDEAPNPTKSMRLTEVAVAVTWRR
jgi:hypothetical protein